MSAEILFVIGTAFTWVGWLAIARGIYLAARTWVGREQWMAETRKGTLVKLAGLAAVCLIITEFVPTSTGRADKEGWAVPLVWFLMPFQMVAALICLVFLVVRTVQSVTSITKQERTGRVLAALIWFAVGALFVWWFRDTGGEVHVYRGAVYATPTKLVVIALFALLAVVVMVWSERYVRARGVLKKAVVHLVLLAGCVVFGVPFAWLLVTSFKEEQDISTATGMVWVPRVQLTVPFRNPEKPLYETTYRGRSVRGTVTEHLNNKTVLLEVDRPYNIRGRRFETTKESLTEIDRHGKVVTFDREGKKVQGYTVDEVENGEIVVRVQQPPELKDKEIQIPLGDTDPVRVPGPRLQNYSEMLEWLPWETNHGLKYLQNTLVLVVMSVIGSVLSAAVVGYGFSRLRFPGRNALFGLMLATMMLPAAVTMLPTFLIFRSLGWIDTLYPLWVPMFFASAFNVFLLRQFFRTIPMELEDAAKIDGCGYLRTLFQVMVPQIQPVLACIAIWTFMGQWNNFMGPLIYVSTPEKMPIAYALQMFQGERGGEFALMMSFATLATIPTLLLFFLAQRYFIEGVQLSGLGGK